MQILLSAILKQLHQSNNTINELTSKIERLQSGIGIVDIDYSDYSDETDASSFLSDNGVAYHPDIELNSKDVMGILQVSASTLARWRASNQVKFKYISSNHVVYPFLDLFYAVKTGKASCKGFSSIVALNRMKEYISSIKGTDNSSNDMTEAAV